MITIPDWGPGALVLYGVGLYHAGRVLARLVRYGLWRVQGAPERRECGRDVG
jgi:hypothetical protein